MDFIKIAIGGKLFRVPPQEILYIKADGNYTWIYLTSGKQPYQFTMQLGRMEELLKPLKDNPFIRVGKSLLVNKEYIRIVSPKDQVLRLSTSALAEHTDLNPSRDALKELIEQL